MNKFLLAGTALCILISFQANASGLEYYVSAKAGYSNVEMDFEENSKDYDAVSFMPSIGVRFNKYLRTELEYAVRGIDEEESVYYLGASEKTETEIFMHSGSLQVYAELPNVTRLTPFVNAGIGVTRTEVEFEYRDSLGHVEKDSDDDTSFTWNVGAGVSAKINDRIALDAMYRYTDFDKVRDTEVTANEFLLGIRCSF